MHAASLATLERLRQRGVGLVILDECHHLMGHWGRVLADVGEFFVDRATGTVSLEGVQLPMIDAGLGQFFTFSATEGEGTVDSLGDIEVSLPLQVFDRWGNPNVVDVMLTTATSTAIVGNSMISIMGQPVGSDGTAELVGLATFESGPLVKETIRIKLNVQVE